MKNTCAEKGDLHHRFQSLTNVFVGGLAQLCCDAGGRVSTGVPPQVGIMCQRSPAPAAVLKVPRSSPGGPRPDYVEWIAYSGGRQEVDRVDDRHGDDVILRAKIESANPVHDLLCKYWCLHIGRLQLAK